MFSVYFSGINKQAFPKDKFKFPKKRLMGNNFDEEFLQVFSSPRVLTSFPSSASFADPTVSPV